MSTHALEVPTPIERSRRRAVIAGTVGNFSDQFDIFVPVIALAAVPALSGHGVVGAGLVFVATMLGRPIGAALLTSAADRLGRARLARLTLFAVALCTGAIAFLPAHGGTAAVTLLLILRFLGGIFLGGQYSAAIPLAMEWSDANERGRISGLIMAMSPLANVTIATLTLLLQRGLGGEYVEWGWRVAFVIGALIPLLLATVGTRNLHDAPAETAERLDVNDQSNWRRRFVALFILMTGLWIFTTMAVSVFTSRLRDGLEPTSVTLVMLVATAASAVAMYGAGSESTHVGRRRFFIGFACLAVVAAPVCYLATTASITGAPVFVMLFATLLQLVTVTAYGPVGAYLAESFPRAIRSRGYGLAYSTSIVLPGLYPFYLPPLQRMLGEDGAPAVLLALAAILVGLGAWLDHREPEGISRRSAIAST